MDSALHSTIGAMFVGSCCTMVLFGITTLQAYFYYVHYSKDELLFRLLVLWVWVLDLIHVVFVGHAMYHYLVSSFGNAVAFLDGVWSLYASMLLNLIMGITVQCFFAARIHSLCPRRFRWPLTAIISFFVVAHFAFGIETVAEFFILKRLDKLPDVTWIAVLPFGLSAVLSDVIIAVALCVLLAKNKTEFQDTNRIINHLIVFAINRCLLTSVVAVTQVIVFTTNPNSFYTLAIDFIIGKLYANSLLATLNSRHTLRPHIDHGDGTSTAEMTAGFRISARPTRGSTRRSLVHATSSTKDETGVSDLEGASLVPDDNLTASKMTRRSASHETP